MAADEFQVGKVLKDAAHDHTGDGQTLVKGSSDARRQAVFPHPLLAETHRRGVHHHRNSKACNQLEKLPSLIVVRVRALMARVDEHALQTAFNDRALELLQKGRAAAGQGAGEDHDPFSMLLLNLGSVVIPATEKRQRFLRGLVPKIMDGIADDAEIDAGAFVGFQ